MLLGTMLFSLLTISHLKNNLEIQVHTRTTIIALKDNMTILLDAETGERGFIITGDTSYLQPYKKALQKIQENARHLRELIVKDTIQRRNLDKLELLTKGKLARLATLVRLKLEGDEKQIETMLITDEGRHMMDKIREVNESMQTIELTLFDERSANTNQSIDSAKIIFIIEGGFALGITLLLAVIIMRELDRRTKAEKQMKAYNSELISKNKEIEQFAYVASHDLQEPLRSISNFSSLLAEKLKAHPHAEEREYMSFIQGGTKRMSSLIFDLLEYSRIGKDLTKSQIDINEVVKECLTDMAASVKETRAEMRIAKLPVVTGYIYLKSVFQNLISNAIKFHKMGIPPVISISAANAGEAFLFSVTDNGIGIEKEYHERIFIIFQRLHTRQEYGGTGIGLSQCRKIVELHGGKIWVESDPGKGSTFKFTIPIH